MISYEMDELLPIVAELSRKYTAGESTSLSYEKAQQLMEAVLYCIHEAEKTDRAYGSMTGSRLQEEYECTAGSSLREQSGGATECGLMEKRCNRTAREMYQIGREAVLGKVKQTLEKYNQMVLTFCDYGNENLRDTVTVAIPGFFKFYDSLFAPQDTIITMDYPILDRDFNLQGIDAVEAYLNAIHVEQMFLGKLPGDMVCGVLQEFCRTYKKQFFNISIVLMRYILMNMLIEKRIGTPAEQEDYHLVWKLVRDKETQVLQRMLLEKLQVLDRNQYSADGQLSRYFRHDIQEFVVQMKNVGNMESLKNVVVL